MARSFSPSEIEESETAVAVRLSDGSTQYLSKADAYEMMRSGGGGGGINVDQLANGATALSLSLIHIFTPLLDVAGGNCGLRWRRCRFGQQEAAT